jgi:hypothetical protein
LVAVRFVTVHKTIPTTCVRQLLSFVVPSLRDYGGFSYLTLTSPFETCAILLHPKWIGYYRMNPMQNGVEAIQTHLQRNRFAEHLNCSGGIQLK